MASKLWCEEIQIENRNALQHYELPSFTETYLQASSIVVEDCIGINSTPVLHHTKFKQQPVQLYIIIFKIYK